MAAASSWTNGKAGLIRPRLNVPPDSQLLHIAAPLNRGLDLALQPYTGALMSDGLASACSCTTSTPLRRARGERFVGPLNLDKPAGAKLQIMETAPARRCARRRQL